MLRVEIEQFMNRVNRKNATLNRDIEIVLTYFGLGTQAYPTYESVGARFGVRRQRAEQIVSDKFFKKIQIGDLEILREISKQIEQNKVLSVDDFFQKIQQEGYISEKAHIQGLFCLLQKFGYCLDYNLYNSNLEPAGEEDFVQERKLFFIHSEKYSEVAERFRTIKSLPGIHGMVNFLDVVEMNHWLTGDNIDLYQSLIIQNETAKVIYGSANKYDMWYLFEERSNVLLNALGKVVNISDTVKTDILAETIHADIHKRSFAKRTPTIDIIKRYLMNSRYIQVKGEFARITIERRELNPIEQDICDYFKNGQKKIASFTELNLYLEKNGYELVHRRKILYHCPILFIDKSLGRRNYQFMLIDQFSPKRDNGNNYETYKKRLKKLQGRTDISVEEKQRREQSILRDWLFKNKVSEDCAICGETYSIHSLAAAHKKKRSICSEEERTDPNIVMPVCVFGCDHLYEDGYLIIRSGHVHGRNTENLQKRERDYIERLENRAVDPKWLDGSEDYFENDQKRILSHS